MLTPRLFDASVFLGPDDASDFIGGVLEASTEYSFIATDLDGLIRLWNQGAQRTYGYDPDEVLGRMSSFDLHIPEDVESGRAAQILATVLDAGKWEGTINRKRKNGDRFLARVVQTPRMDDGGKPIGFLVISKDISEEVRLTKEMVYNRSLIEASLDAQFAIGLDGSITDVNEEATRVTGYARDHLTKLQFSTLFTEPADAAAALRCALDELRVRGFELELETATGETICVSFNAGVFVDASGETAGILVAARDVTGSKDDERAVRGAREESDRANAAKSEFLSRMSHELRTPLNAILGFTQLLELDALQPCSAEKVEQISRAGKQLLGLINEVLDISRIEAGHLVQTAQPVAVSQLLDESADLVRALAERYGVTVSRDDGDGIFVLADRQRLVQVMLNLLSNGIKYNTRGGSVKLSHDQADGRVKIAVADTGVGLPPDRLEELFVPFNRLGVDSTETEGSGLGLALSKVLVEAMGGTLTLASTSPMGSEFVVELPATDVSPGWVPVVARVSAASSDATARPMKDAAGTVLYVEDNQANIAYVEMLFREQLAGVTLLTAKTGGAGLVIARERHPALIILDLHLPDISGEDVLRSLKSDAETALIPVVMLTADVINMKPERSLALGARAHLTKPVDADGLLAIVREIISVPV